MNSLHCRVNKCFITLFNNELECSLIQGSGIRLVWKIFIIILEATYLAIPATELDAWDTVWPLVTHSVPTFNFGSKIFLFQLNISQTYSHLVFSGVSNFISSDYLMFILTYNLYYFMRFFQLQKLDQKLKIERILGLQYYMKREQWIIKFSNAMENINLLQK